MSSGRIREDRYVVKKQTIRTLLDNPIAFHRVFATITGSALSGLFLSQCFYWSGRSTDPDGWFFKGHAEWQIEIGMTRREVDTARAACIKLGILEEQKRGVPCRLFFKVDLDILMNLLDNLSLAESAKLVCTNTPNLDGGKRQASLAESAKLYKEAETTTETTTETTDTPSLFESGIQVLKGTTDSQQVREIFEYYLSKLGRNRTTYTLTPERLKKGMARYRECIEITKDLEKASVIMKSCIDKMASSEFHVNGGYIEWDKQLFGSRERMEQWINKPSIKKAAPEPEEDALDAMRRKERARSANV